MRFLIDVVHPVDVHFYSGLIKILEKKGHTYNILSRNKDVVCQLLNGFSLPHECVSSISKRGRVGQFFELIERTFKLWKSCKSTNFDCLLTRNPAGTIAAKLAGVPCIYDTTDGKPSGLHYQLSNIFADIVTAPTEIEVSSSVKLITYPSQLHAFYLHPNYFQADPLVLQKLNVSGDYFIVRFSAFMASHDHDEQGLDWDQRRKLVDVLLKQGDVLIVSEEVLPEDLEPYKFFLGPEEFLHALAFARAQVGDGVSCAIEAGLLGIPSLLLSSYGEKLAYVRYLEKKYGLVHLAKSQDFELAIKQLLDQNPLGFIMQKDKFFLDTIDGFEWYANLILKNLQNDS